MRVPPLTPGDELFTHQIPFTHATVCTPDPNWRERIWVSVVDTAHRDLVVDCGIARYPNRGIQEAWAGVGTGDRQHNIRMSRHLEPGEDSLAVGPFRLEIAEPLDRVRFVLEDTRSGLGFDLDFESRLRPHIEDRHLEIQGGRITHDLQRYEVFGRVTGEVRWPDGRRTLHGGGSVAFRDHGWGVQPHHHTQSASADPDQHVDSGGTFFAWLCLHFPDWGVFLHLTERAPGAPLYLTGSLMRLQGDPRPNAQITGVDHNLAWDRDGSIQVLTGGELTIHFDDGEQRRLELHGLAPRYFLRSALYLGWRGWFQGDDAGPYRIEHDSWDLTDPVALREYAVAGGGCDHVIEARYGAEVGYGVIEYFTTPGYPKYTEIQGKR